VFSDGFSEGQTTDISGGFPSDSSPYAEQYDYLSDSDLEDADESSLSEGEDEEPPEGEPKSKQGLGDAPTSDPPSPAETSKAQSDNRSTSFAVENLPVFVTPITGLTIISQEWVKSPLYAIWEP